MNIMDIDTVALDDENSAVVIIDQTKLPGRVELINLKEAEEMWNAIYLLQVRGAPAIGVCAGMCIYILSKKMPKASFDEFYSEFKKQKEYLDSSRPTAVNLSWALNRMEKLVLDQKNLPVDKIVEMLHSECLKIRDEDIAMCRKIGEYGVSLLKDGDGVLTHCNAGKLATIKYGTATAPMYVAQEKGMHIRVYCDETRPLLQGARLTAFELQESGMDTTLICDNMSAMVMKKGLINAIFVGADRIAANGDAANKIGTSVVAAVAKQYHIPMYICAPTSTIDMNTKTGDDIVIEERKPDEVTEMWYKERMAPKGVKVFNPAFDVTSHELLAGIITEYGIARAPFEKSIQEMMNKKGR